MPKIGNSRRSADRPANQNAFGDWCEISTCMGVIDWYRANHVIGKSFWAILLFTGLALTMWQTGCAFREFFTSDPYKITVSSVDNGWVPFPYITFCNFNRVKRSLAKQNKVDPKVFEYLFRLSLEDYDFFDDEIDGLDKTTHLEKAWDDYVESGGESDYFEIFRYSKMPEKVPLENE